MKTAFSLNDVYRLYLDKRNLKLSRTKLNQTLEELEMSNLLIIKGSDLIYILTEEYVNFQCRIQNKNLYKWIEPVKIDSLSLDDYYIINSSVCFEPVLLTEHIKQTETDPIKIDIEIIDEYFKGERLIISTEDQGEILFDIYKYLDFNDYFSIVTNESFYHCYERLSTYDINLDEQFIEVTFNNRDFYKNINELSDSSSLINFINEIFYKSNFKNIKVLIIRGSSN
ncbi:hypothetical protein AB4027_06310 [Alkalibacterium putridalgicola]|uniref:hypothetical protein n=1 Tax=Alkalibacterium putridalgicola TaxID=426703 RepID=UPI0034CD6B6E